MVIGILAAVTIVAYNGITKRAVGASLQSDLSGAKTQLALYQAENSNYPTTNDCTGGATPAPPKTCLKSSSGNSFGTSYSANNATNPQTFSLQATRGDQTYAMTESSPPVLVAVVNLTCPSGYIVVPGSVTYGTSSFCVMKYIASNSVGAAVSVYSGLPWVNISQTTATSTANAACAGCHLISEPEWLTIAQNVLSVPGNWSGGLVGSGYIYSGHNDNNPGSSLAADSSDANGYSGETNTGGNQRRTLMLSNGEVIWDMAGNVWQWTSGTSTTGQPGSSGYSYRDWKDITIFGSLSPSPMPLSAYGGVSTSTWISAGQGIGQIYSNSDETALRGFIRGGSWSGSYTAGVLALRLGYAPSSANGAIGFRVAR